ncbi:unnamed protein product [Peronospora destructor]|uniref:Plastocyanin-like domain-containing protein n=1 Tax=Peronospora destructor TaxID=86335 RepID=A0AAV0TBX5_9STRA|nr:unnamed protein product [Peronospora destructor]
MVGLLALYLGPSAADVVTFDWRVTYLFTEYDGVFITSFGINDKPADQAIIEVELGQEVEVRVTNELDEPTCLHWHGMKQLGTQEMDGVSDLTQCHINPKGTAVYRFLPNKPGTFWWHSHHVNAKDEQHPFHMHAHSLFVVGWGVASIDQIYRNELPPLKLDSAMTRDVYTVPPCTSDGNGGCIDAGYIVLRFDADNSGVWIFHCHIDWHLEAGLSMMLVEGEVELQQRGVSSFAKSMLSVCGSNATFSDMAPNRSPASE